MPTIGCTSRILPVEPKNAASFYGTVRFQQHREAGGVGGTGVTDEITTYSVAEGGTFASVTSTVDGWSTNADGLVDENGCAYNTTHTHGEASALGFVNVVDGAIRVNLLFGAPTTYPITTTEHVGCGMAPNDPGQQGGTFATRTAANPEVISTVNVYPFRADGSVVGWQDDCPHRVVNEITSCLVVYDLHPQTAPPASVK
jgi:hypothetical protein